VQRRQFAAHHEQASTHTILFSGRGGGWHTVIMWKPNWACTTCGMLSSRRYSVQRHIRNLHGGNGLVVPYVDYLEGRLTGIYKPDSSKQQQSSLKYSTYLDTFYGATKGLNASSFSSYSNSFMPYKRSEVYGYPSVSSTSYSDQSYKALKTSSSAPTTEDLVSQMTTEYCRELARGLARKALSTTILEPNLQSSVIQGGLGNYPIPGIQQYEDIFGYRFEICKHCLFTDPLEVRFGKDGTKNINNENDDDDVVALIERKHYCDPKLIASNTKEVLDKEGSVKAMVNELPKNAIRMTKWWIKDQKNRLIAIKIPHKNNNDNIGDNDDNNIQPEQERIKIPNPKNPKQQIIFQYSKEKHIEITLTSNKNGKIHWAARSIRDGHTILTHDEMEDFLRRVQTSTFAIFKIHMPSTASPQLAQQPESIGLYFLAVLPHDDNNKSVQPNSTSETFLSLHNRLVNISNFTIPTVNS
jgi:hypothetical protein